MRNNKDFGLPDSLLDAVRQVVEKKLDPVDPKELKGKHADRKDKDIDNDGDVDSTDKFLHRRRKAITKAIAKVGEDDALIGVAKKLKKASQAHAGQADKIMKHVKDMGEAASPAQQAAIAIAMKKAGKKPKNEGAMKRMATAGGMKTFKPKPPAKSEEKKGKKDMIDVKPSMEASELPKK